MNEETALMQIRERFPSIANANLPAVYQSAKDAMQRCADVDEVKDWRDKSEALVSYARQAQDETLEKLAVRIRARAIRRAGELMKVFQSPGGRPSKTTSPKDGGFSQRQAAAAVGFSPRQELTARRVAEIPTDQFEAAIESDDPPRTIAQLANLGRKELSRPKPEGFAKATQAIGQLREFAEFCRKTDPETVASGIEGHEVAKVRTNVQTIDGWLDRLVVNLTDARKTA